MSHPKVSRRLDRERLALSWVLLCSLRLLGDVLEALVAELASPHVAAHNVLAGRVLDVESGGGLDDADAVFCHHLDQLGAGLVGDACVVASLEATLALLHLCRRRLGLGGLSGRIAVRVAHFREDVPGWSRLLLLGWRLLELTR